MISGSSSGLGSGIGDQKLSFTSAASVDVIIGNAQCGRAERGGTALSTNGSVADLEIGLTRALLFRGHAVLIPTLTAYHTGFGSR